MVLNKRWNGWTSALFYGLAVTLAMATVTGQNVPGGSKPGEHLPEIAGTVAGGIGRVGDVWASGSKGTVFVFEEFHTSRVGQLQIAAMILRLHDKYDVRKIGLEGAIQSSRPLNAKWFHHAGGETAKPTREDVAVRMLAEGEISSAEFIALLCPDVDVFGTELAVLYNTELRTHGNPAIDYLLAIAEKGLTQDEIREVNRLIARKQQKEALEYILLSNPWTRDQYEDIKRSSGNNAKATSLEDMKERALARQAKAAEVGAKVGPTTRADAVAELRFVNDGIKRSEVMAKRVITELPGANAPVAMIIGAAHTAGVLEQLRNSDVSFVVLTPNALNPEYGSLSTEQFDRKNKGKWARTTPGTLGRLLSPVAVNRMATKAGIRKPPPIIETATAKSYANATLTGMLIALAARDKRRIPQDVWEQIKALPEVTINRESFSTIEDDVVFSMMLTKTDGTKTTVWTRVGSADTPTAARELEGKLLQAITDLGGGTLPPTDPPTNSEGTKDEGPGDGRRGKLVISRTGLRTLAVYGATKDDVLRVGKISG